MEAAARARDTSVAGLIEAIAAGQVVATSRTSIGAGVACLYAVSTLPARRGREGVSARIGFRDLFSCGVHVESGGGEG